jgi:hypothetical protein
MQHDPEDGEDFGAAFNSRSEDKPFDPHRRLRDPEATLALLGLSRCDGLQGDTEAALVANLIWLVHMTDAKWLFYGRDHNHYVGGRRYYPRFYRRRRMVAAVESFAARGLVVEERTRPSLGARYRSRFAPSDSFLERLRSLPFTVATLVRQRKELIVLKDEQGIFKPYAETDATFALRKDVVEHNGFLACFDITVCHPAAHYDDQGFLVIGDERFDPTRKSYHCVYNGDFGLGGRWYGPWWQRLPRAVRSGILINGLPTRELDIRACHMRLLCARMGIDLGDADPYLGFDFPRAEIKKAVNMLLNAPTWQSAHGAITDWLGEQYGGAASARATEIRRALRARYAALEPFWASGYGLKLQNLDARIAARSQQRLRHRHVPCLSIHDSFVVPAEHEALTAAIMAEEFEWACLHLSGRDRSTPSFQTTTAKIV